MCLILVGLKNDLAMGSQAYENDTDSKGAHKSVAVHIADSSSAVRRAKSIRQPEAGLM